MTHQDNAAWRGRSPVEFRCEKQPATGALGMVVTNHPLASAAGAELMAGGGNAVDAAVGALFALTVVEPMMVGLLGGGLFHLRLPDGRHLVIDGMSTAPAAARPDSFRPVADTGPDAMVTEGRRNQVGPAAVAVPGNLLTWCGALERFGTLPLADVMAPAIRYAANGFRASQYLSSCIAETAADLAGDAEIARIFLPGGAPLAPGQRLVQPELAETLRRVAREGAGALHGGPVGAAVAEHVQRGGGWLSLADLSSFEPVDREPIRGTYRGFEIVGPPPPAAAGVHIVEMLNILEGCDVARMGFGTAESLHLLAEVMKIAFADRAALSGAAAAGRLTSRDYADDRRAAIDPARAQNWTAATLAEEPANTTHVTVADRGGTVVSATHTINSLFGARFMVPGTGLIPNNYMANFDPNPRRALSIAPGKRVPTSMAPIMALRDGRLRYALGLPGGLRIFPSALQALLNLIDHEMTLPEAVEAPRLWTQGGPVEIEDAFPEAVREELRRRGHELAVVPHVGGGMNAVAFHPDGSMLGAACWRADGTAIGIGGGPARASARFWPEGAPRRS